MPKSTSGKDLTKSLYLRRQEKQMKTKNSSYSHTTDSWQVVNKPVCKQPSDKHIKQEIQKRMHLIHKATSEFWCKFRQKAQSEIWRVKNKHGTHEPFTRTMVDGSKRGCLDLN